MDCRVEIPRGIDREVPLPASKSVTARALIINAMIGRDEADAADCAHSKNAMRQLVPLSSIDDVEVMAAALASGSDHIEVGAAGTAMRFLTAYFACQEGRIVVLDGSERMRQRPIGPLVDALRQMGASIEYSGEEGFPPLKIIGSRLHGGALTMRGDISSQFISALLMIAPIVGGVTITLDGDIVSRPYIDMTLGLMRHYGIEARWQGSSLVVPEGQYVAEPLEIEGDWSAASYWFALQALLPQSRIVLSQLWQDSFQGDKAIVEMMAPLGVKTCYKDGGVVELSSSQDEKSRLVSTCYEQDMSATPDLVPTLAVTLCLLRVPFTLTGVETLRLKESDRLEALKQELGKLGYFIEIKDNSMIYDGSHVDVDVEVVLDPHNDHRIAMALSLAATRHKGITIKNAEVVSKSYPNWWKTLSGIENRKLNTDN